MKRATVPRPVLSRHVGARACAQTAKSRHQIDGFGPWLANRVCDLVRVRGCPSGTAVRPQAPVLSLAALRGRADEPPADKLVALV